MKKRANEIDRKNHFNHSCVLCDGRSPSVTFYGKAVCEECLHFVKENFQDL